MVNFDENFTYSDEALCFISTVTYLGDGIIISQFPDGAEAVEELPAGRVPVEDGREDEREEEEGRCEEEEV